MRGYNANGRHARRAGAAFRPSFDIPRRTAAFRLVILLEVALLTSAISVLPTALVTWSPSSSSVASGTSSISPSTVASPSGSQSSSRTAAPTNSPSFTQTTSTSASAAASVSPSGSFSTAVTPSTTVSVTITTSPSITASLTGSTTATTSAWPSATTSASVTVTGTVSGSCTNSASASVTAASTASLSASVSMTKSVSSSPSVSSTTLVSSTQSASATSVSSVSSTTSPSITASLTGSTPATTSASVTVTGTVSGSCTNSAIASMKASPTATVSVSVSMTTLVSSTPSTSATSSSSSTQSASATPVASATATPTMTQATTAMLTRAPSPSQLTAVNATIVTEAGNPTSVFISWQLFAIIVGSSCGALICVTGVCWQLCRIQSRYRHRKAAIVRRQRELQARKQSAAAEPSADAHESISVTVQTPTNPSPPHYVPTPIRMEFPADDEYSVGSPVVPDVPPTTPRTDYALSSRSMWSPGSAENELGDCMASPGSADEHDTAAHNALGAEFDEVYEHEVYDDTPTRVAEQDGDLEDMDASEDGERGTYYVEGNSSGSPLTDAQASSSDDQAEPHDVSLQTVCVADRDPSFNVHCQDENGALPQASIPVPDGDDVDETY